VVLILLALAMFVIDLKAPTHGVLTTGGVVAMGLGSLLLIDTGFLSEGVNFGLILITLILLAGSFGFVLRKVLAARQRPFAAGEESIVGKVGTVREPLRPDGLVFVDGALWQATSLSGPIEAGSQVRVVGIDGLRLRVSGVTSQSAPSAQTPPRAASR
jgi:membrane-bound serine protease (ClpP class)